MSDLRRPGAGRFAKLDVGWHEESIEFNSEEEEERYQAFKRRLLSEVVARKQCPDKGWNIDTKLVDKTEE